MHVAVFVCLLPVAMAGDDRRSDEVSALITTMEARLAPVQDFRCEFEGVTFVKGANAEALHLDDPDEPFDTFSGRFVWKAGGDIRAESIHRRQPEDTLSKTILLVRAGNREAEVYTLPGDSPETITFLRNPNEIHVPSSSVLGQIFLIDEIQRMATDKNLALSVSDEFLDGRPVKVLTAVLRNLPEALMRRCWIDLARNGHVVKVEFYGGLSGEVSARVDVTLGEFPVGDAKVWMPVSGTITNHVIAGGPQPELAKEPLEVTTVKVVRETLKFNTHPGSDVFTMKHKPGPPVSDVLRRMSEEFGRQEVERKLTVDEQLAETEGRGLVAVPPSEAFPWAAAFAWTFGGAVLVSLVALMVQRRRY